MNISSPRASHDGFLRVFAVMVAAAVALMPFNDLPWFRGLFREMGYEGAFYPFLLAFLFWGLGGVKYLGWRFPKHVSFKVLLVWLGWILVSSFWNWEGIRGNAFKGRTGEEKLFLQVLVILFMLGVGWLSYLFARSIPGDALKMLRRWVWIPFGISLLYCSVEIAFQYDSRWAETVLQAVDSLFHPVDKIACHGRLRSVSGEPSWFAMVLAFWIPWLLSWIFEASIPKWLAYFPLLTIFIWLPLIRSRTAFVIVGMVVLLFMLGMIYLWRGPRLGWKKWAMVGLVIMMGLGVGTLLARGSHYISDYYKTNGGLALKTLDNLSNVARYGSWVTATRMSLDHPFAGVGLGQYGFHMAAYHPEWMKGAETDLWMDPSPGSAWPPVHNLHLRIVAELGFVGLVLWLAFWVSLAWGCFRKCLARSRDRTDLLGWSLTVGIVGLFLVGFNADSFRFFGYWILFGFAWAYLEDKPRANDARKI